MCQGQSLPWMPKGRRDKGGMHVRGFVLRGAMMLSKDPP